MKDFNKKLRNGLFLSLGILLLLVNACKKTEATLTPTTTPEPGFKLPQGNNDYDQRIMEYYNKWGTYVLYKFTKQDITYQIAGYDKLYVSAPADPNYINPQLDLLESTFFKYYSDSTLRKYLPVKFFLCSSLTYSNAQVNGYLLPFANGNLGGFESFAANGGNSTVSAINKVTYRSDINFSFLKMMDQQSRIQKSTAFISMTDYLTAFPTTPAATQADRYKRGFLATTVGVTNVTDDWKSFIQVVISNPYSYLIDPATTATDVSAKGILSSVKDPTGIIKRKYDAMIKQYKDGYGIDLQRIGNGF
jgi:hypothetical protein